MKAEESAARMVSVAPDFDLRRLRCTAEEQVWKSIEKNEDFAGRLSRHEPSDKDTAKERISLMKSDLRVDPFLTPALHDLRETLRSTLRLVQPIDLYVHCHPEPNASCLPSRKGTRLVMRLNSALLDLLSPQELLFVMGHEVGHAILEHTRIPRIDFDDDDFSPLEVIRTRALARRQEVSCDRFGLLACQDVDVAGAALLKVGSGVPGRWLEFTASVYAKQFEQITDLAKVVELDDAALTHPIVGLRARALVEFMGSQLHADAMGRQGVAVPTEQMERATGNLLSVLEPDLSEIESASEQDAVNDFLVRGTMAVAAADADLDPAEVAYLRAHMALTDEILKEMKEPEFVKKTLDSMSGSIAVLNRKLSPMARASLLAELCRVALVTGGYADGELSALAFLGGSLEIPEGVFRRVLQVTGEEERPEAGTPPVAGKPPRRNARSRADSGGTRGSGPSGKESSVA